MEHTDRNRRSSADKSRSEQSGSSSPPPPLLLLPALELAAVKSTAVFAVAAGGAPLHTIE